MRGENISLSLENCAVLLSQDLTRNVDCFLFKDWHLGEITVRIPTERLWNRRKFLVHLLCFCGDVIIASSTASITSQEFHFRNLFFWFRRAENVGPFLRLHTFVILAAVLNSDLHGCHANAAVECAVPWFTTSPRWAKFKFHSVESKLKQSGRRRHPYHTFSSAADGGQVDRTNEFTCWGRRYRTWIVHFTS